MSAPWLVTAGVGIAILFVSIVAARAPQIPLWEQRVFAAVNGLPGWLYVALWPPMQLGNLVVGTAAGLVVALVAGELVAAIGVVLAMVMKLVIERVLRRQLAGKIPARQRPGTSQPHAVRRGGDVPLSGTSFPSGPGVLAAAVSCVVAPVLPVGGEIAPFVLTGLVMFGRVYVGAHNPLDVTAGFGAGLFVGALVAALG